MLILTRSIGESIVIDGLITATILSVKGKQIRLGINAPQDIKVHREEVYHRIKDKEKIDCNEAA